MAVDVSWQTFVAEMGSDPEFGGTVTDAARMASPDGRLFEEAIQDPVKFAMWEAAVRIYNAWAARR